TLTAVLSAIASICVGPWRSSLPKRKSVSFTLLDGSRTMHSFLFGAAVFILGAIAVGLLRVLGSRQAADCMMAAQLMGTGGVAVLLLLAVATETPPIVDVAL